ncbi:MAG: NAD+ synthase [Bacillota bacterium]
MKIAVAQINPVVGNLPYNVDLMLGQVKKAHQARANMVAFPELSVSGYPPRDLMLQPGLAGRVQEILHNRIAPASQDIGILLGAPVRDEAGERLYNTALLFYRGNLLGSQSKTLLPDYDVFDENRYFRPAIKREPISFCGKKLGVTICEDVWNDKDYWGRRLYEIDPVEELASKGADLIINLAASPYHYGKRQLRTEMLGAIASKNQKIVFYVNQVGGNDELIFDGSSMVLGPDGQVCWQGLPFKEDFTVFDIETGLNSISGKIIEDISSVYEALILGIRVYMRKIGMRKAVVGLSGGIDSSVTAALAVEALGPDNVLGVAMPSRYSSPGSLTDASSLAQNLGIEFREIRIESVFATFLQEFNKEGNAHQDLAEENLQARIRGNMLMFISNREGHLLLSTGNKSEMAVGYCTLYGDMSGGLAVLADVPKYLVYELARYINKEEEVIPHEVLLKSPSAELRPNQVDQDSLPPYEILDVILRAYIEENKPVDEIIAMGFDPQLVEETIHRVDKAEFKRRQAAPGLRVTSKAFGTGRRFPIAWQSR